MTEGELIRLVRQIIRQELAPIMLATLKSNESNQRSTVQRSGTEGPIGNLRSIQPFGLSSRAPVGTDVLTTPVSFDPTHLLMTGHFDKAKPTTQDGETILYDAFGHMVYLSEDKIQVGTKASAENLVLGQVFKTFMSQVLELIANHTHTGNLGYPTSVPTEQADFLNLKDSPIDDEVILSDIAFTEKG